MLIFPAHLRVRTLSYLPFMKFLHRMNCHCFVGKPIRGARSTGAPAREPATHVVDEEPPLEPTTPGGGCCGVAEVNTCWTSCFDTESDGVAETVAAAAPPTAGADRVIFTV